MGTRRRLFAEDIASTSLNSEVDIRRDISVVDAADCVTAFRFSIASSSAAVIESCWLPASETRRAGDSRSAAVVDDPEFTAQVIEYLENLRATVQELNQAVQEQTLNDEALAKLKGALED